MNEELKMSRRSKRNLAMFLVLVVAVASFFAYSCDKRASQSVRVGYLPIIASLPLHVAQDRAFFKDEDVTVELVEFADSNRLSDALATGTLDVAQTVALAPMANLEASFPGRIRIFSVSKMTKANPFDSVLVTPESGIESLRQVSGKRIGTFPGTTAAALLGYFLRRNGITAQAITPIAPPNQLAALESGSIDALHAYEPVLSLGLSRGYRRIEGSIYAALHEPAPIGCSAMSRRFERDNSDLARRFLSAFDKAVMFIRSNPQEARKILARASLVPPNVAQTCSLLDLSLTNEDMHSHIKAYIGILQEVGDVPKTVKTERLIK